MRSRVMRLVALVCVHTYVRNRLFSGLPLENLLLSVIYTACSVSLNASSVVCYIQRAIQTEQFMPFQIRREGPLGPEIFSYEL